jgi:voltage-gated potassium channel
MKKKLIQLWNSFRASKLGLPFTFLVFYLGISGILVLIFEITKNEHFKNIIDAIWWAIITFSTTGYGDKYPITLGGRIVAVFTIFVGIAAMSFLSGTLASLFVDRNTKIRRGLMDCHNMKGHFIICGWKDHIQDILKEIIRLNDDVTSDDIVIISNIEYEKIEELKEISPLKALHFLKGDYFSETSLLRANISRARRLMILADTLESSAASEVDSKTVMTVLTARALSKDIYICVELLDKKFEHYLKQAMCDEIILVRDYSRMLLANSSSINGITHILYHLLGVEEGSTRVFTTNIPPSFIGKSFCEYKEYIQKDGSKISCLLIGLLENTGSPHKMKMEALREAQKTSDVSRLISNLQGVKSLEVNKPVLIPQDDYIIQDHSMGIIIERVNGKLKQARG